MKLLDEACISYLASYDNLYVGYSGGLDSTVLLHCLVTIPALHEKLTAIHVHHGLSVNATLWQSHCEAFCREWHVPLIVQQVVIEGRSNIEERARVARYQVFASHLQAQDGLLLAHHADDQAETLLLHLFRGTGIDGLSAMPRVKPMEKGFLIRPFLQLTRQTIEDYGQLHSVKWIEDESNQNIDFSRNYLRHRVLPVLREKWPSVVGNIVSCANHCQQAKNNLDSLAQMDVVGLTSTGSTLSLQKLQPYDAARIANILRVWLKSNQIKPPSETLLNHLIKDVIFARNDATPTLSLGHVVIKRYQQTLYLLQNKVSTPIPSNTPWVVFPAPLNCIDAGIYLQALPASVGLHVPTGSRVEVRFRQGGELLYLNGQTKPLKKLLQQWKIPPWQRDSLPLIYINDELAAVVGYAVSDRHRGRDAYHIYGNPTSRGLSA